MLSLFNPSSVAASADANSMVPLSVVKDVLKEVMETRKSNLEFRQSISDHERANSLAAPVKASVGASSGGGGGGSGRSRGGKGQRVNVADLQIKPLPASCPTSVPKNIRSQIFWDVVKIRTTFSTSASAIVESNYSFSLSSSPQASSYIALFDQWCIPQASVSFFSTEAPGGTAAPAELHTAIDFDNVSPINSIASIDVYDNSQVVNLIFGRVHTRTVRPCVKGTVAQNVQGSITRPWLDCAQPSIPWYGIRSVLAQNNMVFLVVAELTIWYAFRGRI